jgi:hypothetical protein
MKSITLVLASLGTVALSAAASAQDDCAAILQSGIWETRQSSGSTSQSAEFRNYSCSLNQQNRNRGLSISVPGYGDLGASAGDASITQACQDNSNKSNSAAAFSNFASKAANAIVQAWDNCMNRAGAHATILYGHDPAIFSLLLRTQGRAENRDTAKIDVVTSRPPSIKCTVDLSKSIIVNPEITIPCKRANLAQTVSVTVNFKGDGSATLEVPRIVPPAVPLPRDKVMCQPLEGGVGRKKFNSPIDVTGSPLKECRARIEGLPQFPTVYRFQIECKRGAMEMTGDINDDGKWPEGCRP